MKITIYSLVLLYSLPLYASWPKVPAPPYAEVDSLVDEMTHNGVPMQVRLFKAPKSVDEVLAYYRGRWSDGFVENISGPWQQISRLQDDYFITVQVQGVDQFSSYGRISVLQKPADNTPSPGADYPMPDGSKVFQDTVTKDVRTTARTLLIANTGDVFSNSEFYRQYFSAQGWHNVLDKDVGAKGHMLVFRQNQDEVTVSVQRESAGVNILINDVKKNGWFN